MKSKIIALVSMTATMLALSINAHAVEGTIKSAEGTISVVADDATNLLSNYVVSVFPKKGERCDLFPTGDTFNLGDALQKTTCTGDLAGIWFNAKNNEPRIYPNFILYSTDAHNIYDAKIGLKKVKVNKMGSDSTVSYFKWLSFTPSSNCGIKNISNP